MEFSHVRLGARIEFFEQLRGPEGDPVGYVGAAFKDEGFVGAGVPSAGDLASVVSLAGGRRGDPAHRLISEGGPFVRVAHVEHYLVPVGDSGTVADWWDAGYQTPSSVLVFRTAAVRDEGHGSTSLARALEAQGWTVDAQVHDYSAGVR